VFANPEELLRYLKNEGVSSSTFASVTCPE
jgi:hypothetical protein